MFINNFIDKQPIIADDTIPTKYEISPIFPISENDASSINKKSKMDAPKIAGIERRKEYLTNL